MKRGRQNEERVTFEYIDMTTCLMLMSQGLETKPRSEHLVNCTSDVYKCKTCHRRFPSFQALGGHRAASHKKPKLTRDHHEELANGSRFLSLAITKAKKTHECAMGQALGGHMWKHRVSVYESPTPRFAVVSQMLPVLSRSNSKRISWLDLDLNLTPLENVLQT